MEGRLRAGQGRAPLFPPLFPSPAAPVSGGRGDSCSSPSLGLGPQLDKANGSFRLSGDGWAQGWSCELQGCGRGASQDVWSVHCWWEGRSAALGLQRGPPSNDAGSAAGMVGGTSSQELGGIVKNAQALPATSPPSGWFFYMSQ